MPKISREDIHLINAHGNWSEDELSAVLRRHVYPDPNNWKRFILLLLLATGVGFTSVGMVYYLALNWNGLHKFLKLGLLELMIVLSLVIPMLPRLKTEVRKIISSAAPILIGALFLVYGKIYQAPALEYYFFLQWLLFSTLWVLLSDFPPLWLLYLSLLHATLISYINQVQNYSSQSAIFLFLSAVDCALFILCSTLTKGRIMSIPQWFMHCVAVAAATFATVGISIGIHLKPDLEFALLCGGTLISFAIGLKTAVQQKSMFFLSLIALSSIIVASSLLLKISNSQYMLLLIGLFIVLGMTAVIWLLIHMQKKDANG